MNQNSGNLRTASFSHTLPRPTQLQYTRIPRLFLQEMYQNLVCKSHATEIGTILATEPIMNNMQRHDSCKKKISLNMKHKHLPLNYRIPQAI